MDVYRCQLAHWREAKKLGLTLTDVTLKSGLKEFAPDWDDLEQFKKSKKTVDDIAVFELKYMQKMNLLWRTAPDRFEQLIRGEYLVLACYCDQEGFCHVELLLRCVEKVCRDKKIPFNFKGIIKKAA